MAKQGVEICKHDPNYPVAEMDYEMKWVCKDVPKNTFEECIGYSANYLPNHFCVVLKTKWNALEENQELMQNFYNRSYRLDNPYYKVEGKHAPLELAGLFVAAYVRGEWHRAYVLKYYNEAKSAEILKKILKRKEKLAKVTKPEEKRFPDKYEDSGRICKVLMIDYGDHKNVPTSKIRRIPERRMDNFPAQAIKCWMTFEHPHLDQREKWTESEAAAFFNLMQDCKYLIEFVKTLPEKDHLPYPVVWKVNVRLVKNWNLYKAPTLENSYTVTEMFLTELQRHYENCQKATKKKNAADVAAETRKSFKKLDIAEYEADDEDYWVEPAAKND